MISVVLCGGVGAQLWPISRESHPKPFIRLPDGQSLLQKTFSRGAKWDGVRKVVTVTNDELFFKCVEEYEKANLPIDTDCILEPSGKNTAPAIAAAALEARQMYGDDVLLMILAADHLVEDEEAFQKSVEKAVKLAREDKIVVFGVTPDAPKAGFGYVEIDGDRVVRFIEKPDAAAAREFLASGNFLWNSGMFCFKAGVILGELTAHAPELLAGVEACLAASLISEQGRERERRIIELDRTTFASVPSVSIDSAVMKKTGRLGMVRCDAGWDNIGSWTNLCNLSRADDNGNHIRGKRENVVGIDAANCDVHVEDRLVALLGVDNLLIADTADAVLVADRRCAEDVAQLFDRLQREGDKASREHRTLFHPWGSATLLGEGPRFKIRRLEIKPGKGIPTQMHHHCNEHWIVVSGMAGVTRDDKDFLLDTNESAYMKAGHVHRVANPGIVPLILIEVACGDYLEDDDVVRFDETRLRQIEPIGAGSF